MSDDQNTQEKLAAAESARNDLMELITEADAVLADDPENEEYLEVKAEAEDELKTCDANIKNLKKEIAAEKIKAAKPTTTITSAHPTTPMHAAKPSIQNPATSSASPSSLAVGDKAQGRVGDDKRWASCTIKSIGGSPSAPQYTVWLDKERTHSVLDARDVRPNKKRPSDGVSETTYTAPSTVGAPKPILGENGSQQAKGKTHRAGRQSTKAHEKGKSSWQSFAASKTGQKALGNGQSQFRTSDDHKSRVGVTGSGKPMSAEPSRKRQRFEHIEGTDQE